MRPSTSDSRETSGARRCTSGLHCMRQCVERRSESDSLRVGECMRGTPWSVTRKGVLSLPGLIAHFDSSRAHGSEQAYYKNAGSAYAGAYARTRTNYPEALAGRARFRMTAADAAVGFERPTPIYRHERTVTPRMRIWRILVAECSGAVSVQICAGAFEQKT